MKAIFAPVLDAKSAMTKYIIENQNIFFINKIKFN